MKVEEKKTYTPDPASRLIFLVLFSVPFVASVVLELQGKGFVGNLLIAAGIILLPQLWFAGQKVVIRSDSLSYQRWFFVRQQLQLRDITKAMLCVGTQRPGHGYYRLEIFGTSQFSSTPLVINVKPFSRDLADAIVSAIHRSSPGAQLDQALACAGGIRKTGAGDGVVKATWVGLSILFVAVLLLAIGRRLLGP
jgi:hypothetical protein